MCDEFIFYEGCYPKLRLGSNSMVFDVPEGICLRSDLMAAYGVGLKAPSGYFGNKVCFDNGVCFGSSNGNWDAFNDCLMDLDWIDESHVHIVHGELPRLGAADQKIYLDILLSSVRKWSNAHTKELAIEYPKFIPHNLIVYFKNREKELVTVAA